MLIDFWCFTRQLIISHSKISILQAIIQLGCLFAGGRFWKWAKRMLTIDKMTTYTWNLLIFAIPVQTKRENSDELRGIHRRDLSISGNHLHTYIETAYQACAHQIGFSRFLSTFNIEKYAFFLVYLQDQLNGDFRRA